MELTRIKSFHPDQMGPLFQNLRKRSWYPHFRMEASRRRLLAQWRRRTHRDPYCVCTDDRARCQDWTALADVRCEWSLTQGLRRPVDRDYYTMTSPPVIVRDISVVGSSVFDWWKKRPPPPGDVRGFDVGSWLPMDSDISQRSNCNARLGRPPRILKVSGSRPLAGVRGTRS